MLSSEIVKEVKADHGDTGEWDCRYDYEDSDYLDLISEEEWVQNHKNQYRECIYWSNKHNRYIAVNESRSGSYHSDWYYDPPEVEVVEKVEREVVRIETTWNVVTDKVSSQSLAPSKSAQ